MFTKLCIYVPCCLPRISARVSVASSSPEMAPLTVIRRLLFSGSDGTALFSACILALAPSSERDYPCFRATSVLWCELVAARTLLFKLQPLEEAVSFPNQGVLSEFCCSSSPLGLG